MADATPTIKPVDYDFAKTFNILIEFLDGRRVVMYSRSLWIWE